MYLFQSDIVLNLTRFDARSCIQSFFSIETFHDICHKTLLGGGGGHSKRQIAPGWGGGGGGGHSKSTIVPEWGGVSLKSERVDKKINSFLSFFSLPDF